MHVKMLYVFTNEKIVSYYAPKLLRLTYFMSDDVLNLVIMLVWTTVALINHIKIHLIITVWERQDITKTQTAPYWVAHTKHGWVAGEKKGKQYGATALLWQVALTLRWPCDIALLVASVRWCVQQSTSHHPLLRSYWRKCCSSLALFFSPMWTCKITDDRMLYFIIVIIICSSNWSCKTICVSCIDIY